MNFEQLIVRLELSIETKLNNPIFEEGWSWLNNIYYNTKAPFWYLYYVVEMNF